MSPFACLYDLLQFAFGHLNGFESSSDAAGRESVDDARAVEPEAAPLGEKARAREERRLERERAKLKEHEREREMWKERGARVCLILASQLCEMKV